MAHKETGEAVAGELAFMVGVEDLWLSFAGLPPDLWADH